MEHMATTQDRAWADRRKDTQTHTHKQRYRLVTTEMVMIQPLIQIGTTMRKTCYKSMLKRENDLTTSQFLTTPSNSMLEKKEN